MNISIFGLGYVGCVSIACLAENGHSVVGVDVIKSKVDLINSGKPTIVEKDIDDLMKKNHSQEEFQLLTHLLKQLLIVMYL